MNEPDFQTLYLRQISDQLDRLTLAQARHAEQTTQKIEQLSIDIAHIKSKGKLIASIIGFIAGLVPVVVTAWWKS